jgi:hypothetical protein
LLFNWCCGERNVLWFYVIDRGKSKKFDDAVAADLTGLSSPRSRNACSCLKLDTPKFRRGGEE